MPKIYPEDRKFSVKQVYAHFNSIRKTADILEVSKSTVHRWLNDATKSIPPSTPQIIKSTRSTKLMEINDLVDASIQHNLMHFWPPSCADVVSGLLAGSTPRAALFPRLRFRRGAVAGGGRGVGRRFLGRRALSTRRAWTRVITDPRHPACVRRLMCEMKELTATREIKKNK